MKLLEDRILKDGKVCEGGVLKVDRFLNHQLDIPFLLELGKEFARLFKDCGVNKILTVETSGISIACATSQAFDFCPVVFAKKRRTLNISGDVYSTKVMSVTDSKVYDVIASKEFLGPDDRILIIDELLANGASMQGMLSLVEQSGATLVGAGVCIEKAFQPGGAMIRGSGVKLEALARIRSMDAKTGTIEFIH